MDNGFISSELSIYMHMELDNLVIQLEDQQMTAGISINCDILFHAYSLWYLCDLKKDVLQSILVFL